MVRATQCFLYASLLLIGMAAGSTAFGVEIEARLLAQERAILLIGGKQYRLSEGERSPEGVLLVSSDGSEAIVEINGQRQRLTLARPIASTYNQPARTEVRIAPGMGGHYFVTGSINGRPAHFMVDTGATAIAMNRYEAERLGINYRAGEPTRVSTAGGTVNAYRVTLNRVAVAHLELNQIAALVTDSDYPEIMLLGNSYLGLLDIRTDDGVLLLQSRY